MARKDNFRKKETGPLVNERIQAQQMQLILADSTNVGIVSRKEALERAENASLDLVQISPSGKDDVPVVKIMDHGKVLYEKKKKLAESKKHQKVIQIKEVKIRPKIGEHDYQTKMKQAIQFLNAGKRVKISLFFRGREIASKQVRGTELFEKINQTLQEHGLFDDIVQEEDAKTNRVWSRIYYLKSIKK